MMLASTFSRPRWAMRQHDFVDVVLARFFDRQVQQRNQAFGPFQRKTLRPQKPLLDEFFEDRGIGQPVENAQLFFAAEHAAIFGPFHPLLQPLAHLQIVHVHELHADAAAIRIAQPLDNAPQRHRLRAFDRGGGKLAIQIGFGQAVKAQLQFRQRRPRQAQGIDLRHQVAAHAVGANQLVDPILRDGDVPLLGRHPRLLSWQRSNRGVRRPRRLEQTCRPERRPQLLERR